MFVESSLPATRRTAMAIAYIVIGLVAGPVTAALFIVGSLACLLIVPSYCIYCAYQIAIKNKIYFSAPKAQPAKPAQPANLRAINQAIANARPN